MLAVLAARGNNRMREILFRGKRVDNGEWVKGGIIPLDIESGYVFIAEPYLSASTLPVYEIVKNHTHLVIPETVGQFTGLTFNGKKIFEGDIVEFSSKDYYGRKEIGQVVIREGCCYIEYIKEIFRQTGIDRKSYHRIGQIERWVDMGASGIITYSYKKIGNIHDNPELLEV